MHAQAATSPKSKKLVQIKVPTMRTSHMPTMLYTNGRFVSPTPCIMPSIIMEKPKNGSDTATIRSTVVPRRMTSSESEKILTSAGVAKNNAAPENIIKAISIGKNIRASSFRRFSSLAP